MPPFTFFFNQTESKKKKKKEHIISNFLPASEQERMRNQSWAWSTAALHEEELYHTVKPERSSP